MKMSEPRRSFTGSGMPTYLVVGIAAGTPPRRMRGFFKSFLFYFSVQSGLKWSYESKHHLQFLNDSTPRSVL